jgi:hypothetical protein
MVVHFVTENRFSPQRASVVNRGQACALAQSEPQRAFDLALTIPDGWYRCQAMAEIALHAPDPLSEKAFRHARTAAAASHDSYQRSAVLAFAIAAALGRGRKDLASAMLRNALTLAPAVEPMASRAHALNLLWRTATHHGDGNMRAAVIAAVEAHVHPDRSWRARRLYRDITDELARADPRKAAAVVTAMPPGKARAYLERRLAPNSPGFPGS